jgi:hypothetical protein
MGRATKESNGRSGDMRRWLSGVAAAAICVLLVTAGESSAGEGKATAAAVPAGAKDILTAKADRLVPCVVLAAFLRKGYALRSIKEMLP